MAWAISVVTLASLCHGISAHVGCAAATCAAASSASSGDVEEEVLLQVSHDKAAEFAQLMTGEKPSTYDCPEGENDFESHPKQCQPDNNGDTCQTASANGPILAACWFWKTSGDNPCPASAETYVTEKMGANSQTVCITNVPDGVCPIRVCNKGGPDRSCYGDGNSAQSCTYSGGTYTCTDWKEGDPFCVASTNVNGGGNVPDISNFAIQWKCCDHGGGGEGDPHLKSVHGARFTVLEEGTHLAWSFSRKAENSKSAVEWQLLADYGLRGRGAPLGSTQGLLLLDKGSGQTMELSTKDCTWRTKEGHGWRNVKLERLGKEGHATSFSIQHMAKNESRKNYYGVKHLSDIALSVEDGGGVHGGKTLAVLKTKCWMNTRRRWIDFRVQMLRRSDLDGVGGELGAGQHDEHEQLFVSKSGRSWNLRMDVKNQVAGTWSAAGGSEVANEYLTQFHGPPDSMLASVSGAELSSASCSESAESAAAKICGKHLDEGQDKELFAECVFDICHGGGEETAVSLADSWN